MQTEIEDFQAALPRSAKMDGSGLLIAGVAEDGAVIISDGVRSAFYEPMKGEPRLGPDLSIAPEYVEAGWFTEANCVTLTDGERRAMYVPVGQPGMD